MSAAVGTLGQLGIGASAPVTVRLDFQSEQIINQEEIIDANGMRGTLSSNVDRTRQGMQRIGGPISLIPNAVELAAILQWILGGTPTGTPTVSYPLADTAQTKTIAVDRTTKVFTYDTCGVDIGTFRCAQGEALNVELMIVGTSESVGNAGTFPSLSIDTATGPWIFSDCVVSIGGTTVTPKQIEISVNNTIDKDRFFNSNTIASITKLDRVVNFSCRLPYGDAATIYNSGGSGAQVVCTFTNGGAILTMTMVKVVFPRKSPNITGRQETMLDVSGRAYKSGSTLELVTTLNPGP